MENPTLDDMKMITNEDLTDDRDEAISAKAMVQMLAESTEAETGDGTGTKTAGSIELETGDGAGANAAGSAQPETGDSTGTKAGKKVKEESLKETKKAPKKQEES